MFFHGKNAQQDKLLKSHLYKVKFFDEKVKKKRFHIRYYTYVKDFTTNFRNLNQKDEWE